MEPHLVFYSGSELLEGPVFDTENGHLYFVSILECLVYCYDIETKEVISIKLDSPVSCVYRLGNKKVLAASKNGFFRIDFNTLTKEYAFQIDIDDVVRYNDGIEDGMGRLIIGTVGFPDIKENIGKVYSCQEGKARVIIEGTTISNGMAFSADHKAFYFIDTPTKKVARYNYELKTGDVSFDAYVIEFMGNPSPDGMCIDDQGMLWIAEWGGSRISRWNPETGRKIGEVSLPCINVTSCCLDNHSNLYVTTARSDSENDINGGGLYYVDLSSI